MTNLNVAYYHRDAELHALAGNDPQGTWTFITYMAVTQNVEVSSMWHERARTMSVVALAHLLRSEIRPYAEEVRPGFARALLAVAVERTDWLALADSLKLGDQP